MVCHLPLCLGVAALTLYWAWSRELDAEPLSLPLITAIGVLVHVGVWLVASGVSGRWRRPWTFLAAAISRRGGGRRRLVAGDAGVRGSAGARGAVREQRRAAVAAAARSGRHAVHRSEQRRDDR